MTFQKKNFGEDLSDAQRNMMEQMANEAAKHTAESAIAAQPETASSVPIVPQPGVSPEQTKLVATLPGSTVQPVGGEQPPVAESVAIEDNPRVEALFQKVVAGNLAEIEAEMSKSSTAPK